MQGTWALTLRSLRQDSRLLRFHWLRFGVAAGLILAVHDSSSWSKVAEAPGRDLLESLGWANFWAVTIAGVLLFAPTITEEKEDQTLGQLRMTGIGPASLLLGKALPKLVQLLLVLIVQLPLVWLTLTLGGVDWPKKFVRRRFVSDMTVPRALKRRGTPRCLVRAALSSPSQKSPAGRKAGFMQKCSSFRELHALLS